MAPGALERGRRLVWALGAEVYVPTAHPPQLEAARPAVVPAPDLRGGAGVPYERRDLAARATTGDPIRAIGRARCFAGAVEGGGNRAVPLRVEPLHAQGNVLVCAERAAGAGEMRVGEEEPEPGVREVLLGAGASPAPTAQRGPPAARPIGALRQPATRRGRAEQATVFLPAHRQLQPDAFVAAQERQVAVRRRRSDDLEASLLLEAAERRDQVPVDRPEQRLQAIEARPPEFHERQQGGVAARRQRRRSLVARGQALGEERVHLARERGARQLVREHRRESDRHGRRRAFGGELREPLQQRERGVERGFTQPVAAVRPAAMIEDVREVTVEREYEVHHRTASARRYSARYCSPERSQPNGCAIAARTSLRHAVRSA